MLTLANNPFFAGLPSEALAPLSAAAEERRLPAGCQVFREGDAGDGMYLVQTGCVEISAAVGPDRRHIFARVGPGEIFGEMAVVEDKPRSAGARALAETTVLFLPRAAVEEGIRRSPALALALLREISQRLREFNRQYLAETLQTERLAVVGRFARAVIHDLKGPLSIIGLTADLVGMENATAATRAEARDRIRRQVERVTELVNEILEFTQGTPTALAQTTIPYNAFVDQVIADLAAEVKLKSVRLQLDQPPPTVGVRMNPRRLHRVFQNLIYNAADAMKDGGTIHLRFETSANEVITHIQDTGPGIAPEIAGQLFEPFVTHGKLHGTGLGLSISKRIIEDHGGRITAGNAPSGGALFSITLPCLPPR